MFEDITAEFRHRLRKSLHTLNCEQRIVGQDYLDAWEKWSANAKKQPKWHWLLCLILFPFWLWQLVKWDRHSSSLYADLELKQKRWNDSLKGVRIEPKGG